MESMKLLTEWCPVSYTKKMIKEANSDYDDVDGFVEFIRTIQGVEISFMILEKDDSSQRISFRSSGVYTVNDIAMKFNGGGHKFAAGAGVFDKTTKEVEKEILSQIQKKMPEESFVN